MAVFKHLKSWTGEDNGLMARVRHESDSMDGATSYEELSDKPSINGVILQGNTELDALGVQPKGNYITVEETETRITEAINALEIPQEYITETELEEKGYLTEHQDLTGYAKMADVPTKVSQLTNDKNYLTSIPSEYITENELDAKGYSNFSGNYNDLTGKPTTLGEFTNDVGYLTNIPVEYVTETELANAIAGKADTEDIPSIAGLETKTDATLKLNEAKTYTDTKVAELIDSAPETMNTLNELAVAIQDNDNVIDTLNQAIGTKANSADLASVATSGSYNDLSDIPTIPTVPTNISSFTNDSGYITNQISTNVITTKNIYLGNIQTSVNNNAGSRLVFGTPEQAYSWLASNNSGAFAFSRGSGNISIYPKTGQYNCIVTDCDSDLGRADKPWNNMFLRGTMSDGTNACTLAELKTALDTIATLQSTISDLEGRIAVLEGGAE